MELLNVLSPLYNGVGLRQISRELSRFLAAREN